MRVKLEGKDRILEDLEKAEELIQEVKTILWRMPPEINIKVSEDITNITDSVPDNQ